MISVLEHVRKLLTDSMDRKKVVNKLYGKEIHSFHKTDSMDRKKVVNRFYAKEIHPFHITDSVDKPVHIHIKSEIYRTVSLLFCHACR